MNKNKKRKYKKTILACFSLSVLSTMPNMINVSAYQDKPSITRAAIGSNIGGNGEGVDWGGEFFSWKLTVDGKPAFCINLGLPPTNGEEMKEKVDAVTEHPEFKRLVYAGLGMDGLGLIGKYRLNEHDAYKGTIPLYHVIENRLKYGPQKEQLTEERFKQLAEVERKKGNSAVADYSLALFDFVLNGKLPETAIKITNPSSIISAYNQKTNRLETGEYTVNDVQSNNITVTGLPTDVYMVDSVTGKRIEKLVKNQKFKLVTENLAYTNKLNKLTVSSNVNEFTPIIWSFEGVQDVMQSKILEPATFTGFKAEFQSVLGKIEFRKMNATKNKPLVNIPFELIDMNGKVIQTVKSAEGGKVTFDNVLAGTYKIKEVTTTGDGIVDENIVVDVTVVAGKITTLKDIVNKENEISLSKLDNENNKPVKDAKVDLINKEGKVVWSGDGNSKITGIPAGEYTLKETMAPTRYILNPEITKVKITEDGQVSVGIIHDETRDIRIVKKDGKTGKPLKGAKFKLVKLDGTEMQMLDDNNELVPSISISDENGVVRFRGMPIGDYKVVELEAPKGYTTNSDLSVKAEEKNDTEYDFIDYEIPEKQVVKNAPGSLPKTSGTEMNFFLAFVWYFASTFASLICFTLLILKRKKVRGLNKQLK